MDIKVVIMIMSLAAVVPIALAQDGSWGLSGEASQAAHVMTSSRLLKGEQKSDWLRGMHDKISISKRPVGPFGLPQDPEAKIAKPQKKEIKKGAFLEAIAAIKINTVMPSEGKFTSNSREFAEGDRFPIIKNQRQFNIEVMQVDPSAIVFKNIDSGEQVRKKLDTLPDGMKKNALLDTIPGVFPANEKNTLPLDLDEGSASALR